MKLLWVTVALGIALAAAVTAHFMTQSKELRALCQGLPTGLSISEVRDAAADKGFETRMEPYTQMYIEPSGWHFARPSCRVFFNKNQVVEYRVWQD